MDNFISLLTSPCDHTGPAADITRYRLYTVESKHLARCLRGCREERRALCPPGTPVWAGGQTRTGKHPRKQSDEMP